MLTISLNPIHKVGAGMYTLTGFVSELNTTIEWWYTDAPTIKYQKWVSITSTTWILDLPITSTVDIISIQATVGLKSSNILEVNLGSKTKPPVPTFQFNEFDELGLESDIVRLPLESNINFKSIIQDVYKRAGSSSHRGLIQGIERELRLPKLSPFFWLSVRFDPRTGKVYKNATVSFSPYKVSVQLDDWVIYKELIEIDPITFTFKTKNLIGNEDPSVDNIIKVFNGEQSIDDRSFKVIDDNTIELNYSKNKTIDINKKLYITYPYKKSLSYINSDKSIITVNNIKLFLEGIETVQDELGNTRPLIVWNNGFFEEVFEEPSSFNSLNSLELAINNQPLEAVIENVKVTSDTPPSYYHYINKYKSKDIFSATHIIPQYNIVLSEIPIQIDASYVKLDALYNKDFQELLLLRGSFNNPKNLAYYARRLRALCRLGIKNAIVNKDEWDSDIPDNIGDNFIPSEFDGGAQDFSVLNNDGSIQKLDLNQRRYFATMIANQS